MTMHAAISQFLRYLRAERNVSPHTLDAYASDLAAFAAFLAEEEIEWQATDRPILRRYVVRLQAAGVGLHRPSCTLPK